MTMEESSSNLFQKVIERASVRHVAIAASAVALAVYAITMNTSFGFIDKGELSSVASTLGIAHPTGYPTFTILGWITKNILGIVGVRPVVALNILAAVLVACSVGALTYFYDVVLRMVGFSDSVKKVEHAQSRSTAKTSKKAPNKSKTAHVATSAVGLPMLCGEAALATAFTATWWNQSNGFEVYALHVLMLPLVSWAFLRYVQEESSRDAASMSGHTRRGTVFALLLGLSFTNHMTTILLGPAFLVYYFWSVGVGARAFKRLPYLVLPFLVGLLPYLYLPIRAATSPQFNWGNPSNLERFLNHWTGQQYRVWMFSSSQSFGEQTSYFFKTLPSQFAMIGLGVAVLGLAFLAMRSKKLLVLVSMLFLTCVFYAGGYDITDIDSYYLTAFFAMGTMMAVGFGYAFMRFGRETAVGVALGIALFVGIANFNEANERPNTLVEDMTTNMLSTVPKNALVLSSQWDFWVSGSWYLQAIEHMRPDVLVVDNELLRRSWYLDQLTTNHPEFMALVKNEVDAFRKQVYKFEHQLPYVSSEIQGAYIGMISAMIDKSMPNRPVLITAEIPPEYPELVQTRILAPYHLAQRIVSDSTYLPQEFPAYKFSHWFGHIDVYTSKVYELYARAILSRGTYEAKFGHDTLANRYLMYARTFDPKWTSDMIPPLSRGGRQEVQGMIDLFERIQSARPRSQEPGARGQ